MNDFTKEELEELHYLANYFIGMQGTVHDEAIEIRDKLQSMMDIYDAQVIEVWHCEKCGHVQ